MPQMNLWGYFIYWLFGDIIDLITFGTHVNHGIREYFSGAIDSPVLALFLTVGTFLDLRLFMVVLFLILFHAPQRFVSVFLLRILRIIDKLPFIP